MVKVTVLCGKQVCYSLSSSSCVVFVMKHVLYKPAPASWVGKSIQSTFVPSISTANYHDFSFHFHAYLPTLFFDKVAR